MKTLILTIVMLTMAACTTLTPEQRDHLVARHTENEKTMCNPAVCDSYTSNPNTSLNRIQGVIAEKR